MKAILGAISMHNPNMMYIKDRQGRMVYANHAVQKAVGKGADKLLGKTDIEWHHELQQAAEWMENDRRIMESGTTTVFDEMMDGAEGLRWYRSTKSPFRDADGNIIGIIGHTVDVTEEKLRASALQESQTRWQAMAEAMPVMMFETHPKGGNIWVNQTMVDYSGLPLEELIGDGWMQIVHPEDLKLLGPRWFAAVESREVFESEHRFRRHDGPYRWFIVRAVPILDPATGQIIRWFGTCSDIQALHEARAEAEAANVAKSEFLASMSHEIRTPLNAVIGLTDIMLRYPVEPGARQEYLKTMKDSADALLALVNDVLDFARIESSMVELEFGRCNVGQLAADCMNMVAVKAAEKGVSCQLVNELPANLPFQADAARLRQVIINLLSNAVKFTERGTITLHLRGTPGTPWQVQLSVADTGIGIPPDKVDRIFEKFTQADASTTRRFGGTGLGLAISRRLAELMGGTLTVTSVPQQGSTFTLALPLLPMQAAAVQGSVAAFPAAPFAGLRALLVEDHPANTLVATTLMQHLGLTVETATDGAEAIRCFQKARYDVIFMDMQMPNVDGFTATQAIRQLERLDGLPRTPIVAMTAFAVNGDREKCLLAGMDDYIAKPFPVETLEAALHRVIRSREMA